MATYNITMTKAALRNWSSIDLPHLLVRRHRTFDPSLPSRDIKVFSAWTHPSSGVSFHCNGRDEYDMRYIRVVIDLPAGKSEELKQVLMVATTECCMEYQGKHADECTVEVRIDEFELGNCLVTEAKGRR